MSSGIQDIIHGKGSLDDQKYQSFGHVSTITGVACPGNRRRNYQESDPPWFSPGIDQV